MPLRETEAIVLRTYRLGEYDKIASVMARHLGRLRAVAKGARSRRSRYGSTLEPLSYIRLWIYERENRDLQYIQSADLIESFFDMQKDYRVQVAAQFVAEVAERVLPEREVNERAFRLLLAVLRAFKHSGEVTRPLLYFDFWLLRLEGFLPDLAHCALCGRELAKQGYYGPGSEGLTCEACRSGPARQTVSTEVLSYVESARQMALDHWLADTKPPAGVISARRFFEEVLESHLEKPLATRRMLEETEGTSSST